jgi:hypothetical protein
MRSKEFRTQIWQNKMRRRTRRRTATSSYGHRPHGSLAGSAGQGRRCRLGRRHALLHQPLQRGELGLIRMVASSNIFKYFYRFFLSCTSLGAPMPLGERSSIAHLRLAPFRPIEVLSIEKAMCQKPTRERGTQHVIRCQRLHLHSVLLSIT